MISADHRHICSTTLIIDKTPDFQTTTTTGNNDNVNNETSRRKQTLSVSHTTETEDGSPRSWNECYN